YSPVINAVDFAARAFPLVRPQPILVDTDPLTHPVIPDAAPLPRGNEEGALWPVLLLPVSLLFLLFLLRVGGRRYQMPAVDNSSTQNLSAKTYRNPSHGH